MKISYFILGIFLLYACQENDDLVIQVRDVTFKTASTENEYSAPIPTTDSIRGEHFLFEVNWEIERTDVGYDPVETTVINSNPVDSVKIWSDQVIAGRSPGSSLNTLFGECYSLTLGSEALTENGGLTYYSNFNTFEDPLRKVSYLIPQFQIEPGSYNFHFRCVLRDGTAISNTLTNVIIK